jgi:protein-disulfide isomerase
MKAIIEEFGKDGKVAWVYRNFPLATLHPNAPKVAEAAECVAELNGNDTYWEFLDALFLKAPAGTALNMDDLPSIAESVGVDTASFSECYNSGRMKAIVDKEFNDAVLAGQQLPDGNIGTPFNVILAKGNPPAPVIGAQPLAAMRQIMQTILAGPSAQVLPQ